MMDYVKLLAIIGFMFTMAFIHANEFMGILCLVAAFLFSIGWVSLLLADRKKG